MSKIPLEPAVKCVEEGSNMLFRIAKAILFKQTYDEDDTHYNILDEMHLCVHMQISLQIDF